MVCTLHGEFSFEALEKYTIVWAEEQESSVNAMQGFCTYSVLVRLRPCAVGDLTSIVPRCPKSLAVIAGQEDCEYHFDAVLPQGTSQRLVFAKLTHLVKFAVDGGKASIISYGQASPLPPPPLFFLQGTGLSFSSLHSGGRYNLHNSIGS